MTITRETIDHWNGAIERCYKHGSNTTEVTIEFLAALLDLADEALRVREHLPSIVEQIKYTHGDGCPCGAREATPSTHPHVTGCGFGFLRSLARRIAAEKGGE